MCGICGFLGNQVEEPLAVIRQMAASIRHRGDEANGFFVERPVALGHQRLSILDLGSRADQPFKTADGRFVIVFNGEIYNYRELQGLLHDFSPRTTSDTEILAELWAQQGAACLQHLNGMFAFAIYDRHENSLYCARDRLGVKPFYYWSDRHEFVFASEAKAVLMHPGIKFRSITALLQIISRWATSPPFNRFCRHQKLESGCFLKVSPSGINKICYWNLGQRIATGQCHPSQDILELLDSAIEYRLISDVPVGSFLSAGIDSSAITAIAARKNTDLQTFTIGFKEKTYDESLEASRFAGKLGLENHIDYFFEPDIAFLQKVVKFFDQPFADTSVMPYFQLCSMAARQMKVVLSGDGGDELFAGYETRRADLLALAGYRAVPFWNHLLQAGSGLLRLIPADRGKVSMHYKMRQFCDFAHLPPQQSHFSWRLLFTEAEKRRLLSPQIVEQISGHETWNTVLQCSPQSAICRCFSSRPSLICKAGWLTIFYTRLIRLQWPYFEVRSPFLITAWSRQRSPYPKSSSSVCCRARPCCAANWLRFYPQKSLNAKRRVWQPRVCVA